jgi:hypothetical protein
MICMTDQGATFCTVYVSESCASELTKPVVRDICVSEFSPPRHPLQSESGGDASPLLEWQIRGIPSPSSIDYPASACLLGKGLTSDSLPRFGAMAEFKRNFGDIKADIHLRECQRLYAARHQELLQASGYQCKAVATAAARGVSGSEDLPAVELVGHSESEAMTAGHGGVGDSDSEHETHYGVTDAALYESFYGSRWVSEGRVYAVKSRHSSTSESNMSVCIDGEAAYESHVPIVEVQVGRTWL